MHRAHLNRVQKNSAAIAPPERQTSRKSSSIRSTEFRFEDQLLPLISGTSLNFRWCDGIHTTRAFQKMRVGRIIPDIVFVTHNEELLPPARANYLTFFECAVMAEALHINGGSEEGLAARLFTQPRRISNALQALAKRGLISISESGAIAVNKAALPNPLITSVEAKLVRWTDAIEQAKAYLRFSHAAFVALPYDVILRNSEIQKRCSSEGIGLLSVSRADVIIVVDPVINAPSSCEWLWLLGRSIGFAHRAPKY